MSDQLSRRAALALGITAAGSAIGATPALAQPRKPKRRRRLASKPAAKAIVPLPFAADRLSGLSAKLLTLHHGKNYAGAVNKLNMIRTKLEAADPGASGSYWSEYGTLKAGEAAARNSALLHELYFANLIGPGRAVPAPFAKAMGARFGSTDAMVRHMKACGKATGAWVILAYDPESSTIEVVPIANHSGGAWHCQALLVLDVFEHSYALDFGPDKAAYLDAFFRNLNWPEVGRRFDAIAR